MEDNPSAKKSLANWWKSFQRSAQSNKVPQDDERPRIRFRSRSSTAIKTNSDYKQHIDDFFTKRKERDNYLTKGGVGDNLVFNVTLESSLEITSAKVALCTDINTSVTYGRIPTLVVCCGLFLKQQGLDKPGIFRMPGAARRVRELQVLFSSPPTYGAKFDWNGYTVHDAASILRRYLTSLSEPLIPLDLYEAFRSPILNRPLIVKYFKKKEQRRIERDKIMKQKEGDEPRATRNAQNNQDNDDETPENMDAPLGTEDVEDHFVDASEEIIPDGQPKRKRKKHKQKLIKEIHGALAEYVDLFSQLSLPSRQLIYYLVDLLQMVSTHSSTNLMSVRNLASIFQPSLLFHPKHDLEPEQYILSQAVVEFWIEYSDRILRASTLLESQTTKKQKPPPIARSSLPPVTEPEAKRNSLSSFLNLSYSGRRKHSKSMSSAVSPPDVISNLKHSNLSGTSLEHTTSFSSEHTHPGQAPSSVSDNPPSSVSDNPQSASLQTKPPNIMISSE
ncbi:hypothetical protein LJB42_001328 [Komagataella kurtzmanii]|nr:hypothetical protein LJB42_001328 [Komagataella kurtzmanii]